ncbi:anti-sigma B factor antagonist [Monaibacterium marinum]|uniref:Anti-sigma factor antagonist n=1 Tax=Pontivivens marinum TaxID=1690039 RepID=A0A2C9CUF9_9RHOB|nr:STAS domain-containing protein [Monaibacterium marinum]SOH94840.1 anti-sigma B factor antagonist [Monaibacterium marinum]
MIHTTSYDPDITAIRPGIERLTAMNAKAFKDEIISLIDAGSTQLIVDFKDITFVDSSGLGALVGILKKIGNRGDLALAGLNSDVVRMFQICRMDRVFTSYPDVASAVQTMSERP